MQRHAEIQGKRQRLGRLAEESMLLDMPRSDSNPNQPHLPHTAELDLIWFDLDQRSNKNRYEPLNNDPARTGLPMSTSYIPQVPRHKAYPENRMRLHVGGLATAAP